MRRRPLLSALALLAAGCRCAAEDPRPPAAQASAPAPASADPASRAEIAPGITLERVQASITPPFDAGDRRITLVRVDPRRYVFRLLTAAKEGGSRTAPRWAKEFGLAGVINASMYGQDRRSVGLMVDGELVNNGHDDARFGGILGLRPRTPSLPDVALFGRDCAGFDLEAVREDYRTVLTNYRLLDCSGAPIAWKDEKAYSSAAIGIDREGWFVLVHSRTPYSMTDMAAMLGAPDLGLKSAVYVEGGPEASLFVEAGGARVAEIGSYESRFNEDDANAAFWEIPNVIGFSAR